MADPSPVRQRIISSVFSKRNAAGVLEESYVAHVKIWEDGGPDGDGKKPRYILLSGMRQYSMMCVQIVDDVREFRNN
jgi:exocyst complex component 1